MDNSQTIKQLFYGELVLGSRPVGRPRLCYKDNIKALLKSGGILESWNDLALDHVVNVLLLCGKLNAKRIEKYERRKDKRKR